MVDYEWGNPSSIMLTGDEATQETNQSRQIFDHYTTQETLNVNTNTNDYFHQPAATNTTLYPHHHYHHHHQQQHQQPHHNNSNNNVHSLFDPRAYASASAYAPTHHQQHHSMLSIDPVFGGAGGYFMIPKTEEVSRPADNFASRIGLNLGGRTYFSSADDDDFVNRLYRRPRPGEPGSANIPRCQAEGCNADLTHSKHYHRRHKVCEFHSKASTVITAGLTQRFCQQCSRFHLLCEFDNGKRSCRKRLADHNRRRRKYQQQPNTSQNTQNSQLEGARNSSSENLAKSPSDSGAHSSSSVTVGVSPPRMSLECFSQKHFQATASSLAPSSSLFFSSG